LAHFLPELLFKNFLLLLPVLPLSWKEESRPELQQSVYPGEAKPREAGHDV
jgi:hypothetical protein